MDTVNDLMSYIEVEMSPDCADIAESKKRLFEIVTECYGGVTSTYQRMANHLSKYQIRTTPFFAALPDDDYRKMVR